MEIRIKVSVQSLKISYNENGIYNYSVSFIPRDKINICNENIFYGTNGTTDKKELKQIRAESLKEILVALEFFQFISKHSNEELIITVNDNNLETKSKYSLLSVEVVYD